MEALKEKNGSKLQDILEIGKITGRMGLVFNSTKTEISMKACGVAIRDMDKELIGETKVESSVENTLVTGLKIRNMVEEPSSIKMETDTTAIGSMVRLKVKVE